MQNEGQEESKEDLEAKISEYQRQLKVGNLICEKASFDLVEFEEFIMQEGGCWIKFNKLPPPEEE